MWSLGCVLHELATRKVAFSGDLAVILYNRESESALEIKITSQSGFLQHHVSENIRVLLERDPKKRLSASLASRIFASYCQILELPSGQVVCNAPSYPTHQQWQKTVNSHLSKPKVLSQLALAKLFEDSGLARSLQDNMIQAYGDEKRRETDLGESPNSSDVEIIPLYSLGKLLADDHRYEESITVYNKLLDKCPSDIKTFIRLAEIYVKSGQYDQALRSCRLATEVQPTNFWLWRNLFGIYVTRRDYAGAIIECNKALERFPSNISLTLILVDLYMSKLDYNRVVETYMDHICAQENIKRNWVSAISQDTPDAYSEELKVKW